LFLRSRRAKTAADGGRANDAPGAAQLGELTAAAVYANSFIAIDRSLPSTGVRASARRGDALAGNAPEPAVGDAFLVNTRLRRNDRDTGESIAEYFNDVASVMLGLHGRRRCHGADLPLPHGTSMRLALSEALARRRSVRSYTGDAATVGDLAAILVAASGVTGEQDVPLSDSRSVPLRFRAVASAGGLYPIDLLFVAINVDGLGRGIYRYEPLRHALSGSGDADDVAALLECFAGPQSAIALDRACGILLLIGQPWRSVRKYGQRGMRFVFLEAGAIAHSVALAATALGYGSVDCASVYDDEVHEVLGLDGVDMTLLHAVVVGCPA
jgi:SagB-type dehydrogenase family enzyme